MSGPTSHSGSKISPNYGSFDYWVIKVDAAGNKSAGASSASQRTLTIIVKFDDAGLVRDFSYRTSSF